MKTLKENLATQYVLRKHHLLEGTQADDVVQVVEDIIALHATSASTPYLSLFARMKNFQKNQLDQEFYVKRNLVRLKAMRGTLFITSTASAPILHQATMSGDQSLKWLDGWGMPPAEYDELKGKLRQILKGNAKTLTEVRTALPSEIIRLVEVRVGKTISKVTNVSITLNAMVREGIAVSEKESETFRTSGANRYALLEDIYPDLSMDSVQSEEAKALLTKRYLSAFGPATMADITWWTGFTRPTAKKALETLEKDVVVVSIGDLEEEYLMLKADFERFSKSKPMRTRSVSLLPYEDPYTKGYKARNRLIRRDYESRAYVGGAVQPTILLNGEIIGTWNRNIEQGKGPIELHFFQRQEKAVKEESLRKAREIGRMMTGKETVAGMARES